YSYIYHKIRHFSGHITVPGDKSISHRALMFGAMALGKTSIKNLLMAHDVMHTKSAMRALGADIVAPESSTEFSIQGVGVGGFKEPENILDFGNAGTGSRLTMGLVAPYDFSTTFTGDASLCKRPMGRILTPLQQMGVKAFGRSGQRLPLTLVGAEDPVPIDYTCPVASAQVKSAILLAGLNCPGTTFVREKIKTRDHTEKMLKFFGADIETYFEDDHYVIALKGYPTLEAQNIIVPADPSSAAFPIVAAIITEDSQVTIENVLLNPERAGLFETLKDMGADIEITNQRQQGGEDIGDITARSSRLKGIDVPKERVSSMIDEFPILCVAAAVAEGTTSMRGLEELRVKESDRIHAMVGGLKKIGVHVKEFEDGMDILGGDIIGGRHIETFMDHRIAMSFLIAGAVAQNSVSIDNGAFIATSFPHFDTIMNMHGLHIEEIAA
ncbi:MAG: 3-phosphoshikimate 1-carboxyvinyltransferase, partial [Pseudomonadota bacterium]